MKRAFFTVAAFLFAFSVSVNAQDYESEDSSSGGFILSVYGNIGGSMPKGDVPGVDADPKIDLGYTAGLGLGFKILEGAYITLGGEYASKQLKLEDSVGDSLTYNTSFANIMAGIKGVISILYVEGGIYYGVPVGTWDIDYDISGSTGTWDLDKDFKHGEFGLYLGVGVFLPIGDTLAFEAGLGTEVGLTKCVYNDDVADSVELWSRLYSLKVGLTFRM